MAENTTKAAPLRRTFISAATAGEDPDWAERKTLLVPVRHSGGEVCKSQGGLSKFPSWNCCWFLPDFVGSLAQRMAHPAKPLLQKPSFPVKPSSQASAFKTMEEEGWRRGGGGGLEPRRHL